MDRANMTITLLSPINDVTPTGPDLEYDPAFTELERFATPTAERTMGDSLKAALEPDWHKVAEAAETLLARTKDLRIAVHLLAAQTRIEGLAGWTSGLGLIRGLLEKYWDRVHPQLEADDDHDPTTRINALIPLGDPQGVLGYFRLVTFVQSPRLGRFSLRDLRIATGSTSVSSNSTLADGSLPPTLIELEASCMDCSDGQLPESAAHLATALDHARSITSLLREKLGTASPDLSHLCGDIEELKKFIDAQLIRRFPARLSEGVTDQRASDDADVSTDSAIQPTQGQISGHADVIRRIDEICEYYERIEPSSPLPVLLKRARRLVGKTFADVLKDIAPGGLAELQMLSGPDVE